MTNDMRTSTPAPTVGRLITIAAGAAGSLLLWSVRGRDLDVRQGDTVQTVGPVAVVVTALLAGLAAWALLAVLERTTRRPVLTYRIIATLMLLISLAGPLSSGIGGAVKLALIGLHLTVGLALIIGLPGRRSC
jgi:hypothetical protein